MSDLMMDDLDGKFTLVYLIEFDDEEEQEKEVRIIEPEATSSGNFEY